MKKRKVFKEKSRTTYYALTTPALSYIESTQAFGDSQQKELIDAYAVGWNLKKKSEQSVLWNVDFTIMDKQMKGD